MADMAWEVKCREEDMKQRALENERHAIDDARRAVDEKAQQLKVLANQSALVAGFSMVVLVESNIPPDINGALLTLFGGVTACVIALMLVSTLNATYMLVAILRYDCVNREVPFDEFWRKRCEPDWKMALRTFSYGIPLFMVVVALVAWVSFWDHESLYYSASVVTAISVMVLILWFGSTERKWGEFLRMSDARILTRGMSFGHEGDPTKQSQHDGNGGTAMRVGGRSNSDGDSNDESCESFNISALAVGELTSSDKILKR